MFRPPPSTQNSAESIKFFCAAASPSSSSPAKDYGTCSYLIKSDSSSSLSSSLSSTSSSSSSSSSSSQSSLAKDNSNLFETLNLLEAQTGPVTKSCILAQLNLSQSKQDNTSEEEKTGHQKPQEEEEEEPLNFPMSFVRSVRRSYRQLQSTYIYDRVVS